MSPRRPSTLPWWLNTAWMWQCRREALAFREATAAVRATQEELLRATLRANARSRFGREHDFASIRSIDEFRAGVPISNYEAIRSRVDRLAAGEQQVLTAEPVLMFEPTGGSVRGAKLIPYTVTLRRQFQRAVAAWIWDVLVHVPGVRAGTAYWSISPAVRREARTAAGIRIGFNSDQEYLDGAQRLALSRLLVVPPEVSRLRNADNFRYATLGYLLAAEDLALISVWSPTFLTVLLDALPVWGERLCRDLRDGKLRLPAPAEEPAVARLPFARHPGRSRVLREALGRKADAPDRFECLWPHLALISCWADGSAEMYAPELRSRFPRVSLQPKGLLATEGVVSIPIVGQPGAALAIRSHVFEFLEVGDVADGQPPSSRTLLAHELQLHRRYRVLLTTGGGLYRYDLGDLVEPVGFLHECPLLRFLGRHGFGSDLVGEKLNEQHVRECLRATFEELDVRTDFALVAAQADSPRGYLALIVAPRGIDADAITRPLAQRLEARLRENPHYRDAVDLQQLRPIEIHWLQLPPGRAWQIYEERCTRLGQKPGDIKPTALDPRPGWADLFGRTGRN